MNSGVQTENRIVAFSNKTLVNLTFLKKLWFSWPGGSRQLAGPPACSRRVSWRTPRRQWTPGSGWRGRRRGCCPLPAQVLAQGKKIKRGFFRLLFFMYVIQHCFICHPQVSLCRSRRMLGSNPGLFRPVFPGSGSGSKGSTCFWASRIRLRILLSSCKNSKKNLDSYYFATLFGFLSLENTVNVPSNSNKQKKCLNKNSFLLASWRSMTKKAGSGSISQRHGSADPDLDPLQNVMDPEHWFRLCTDSQTL